MCNVTSLQFYFVIPLLRMRAPAGENGKRGTRSCEPRPHASPANNVCRVCVCARGHGRLSGGSSAPGARARAVRGSPPAPRRPPPGLCSTPVPAPAPAARPRPRPRPARGTRARAGRALPITSPGPRAGQGEARVHHQRADRRQQKWHWLFERRSQLTGHKASALWKHHPSRHPSDCPWSSAKLLLLAGDLDRRWNFGCNHQCLY